MDNQTLEKLRGQFQDVKEIRQDQKGLLKHIQDFKEIKKIKENQAEIKSMLGRLLKEKK